MQGPPPDRTIEDVSRSIVETLKLGSVGQAEYMTSFPRRRVGTPEVDSKRRCALESDGKEEEFSGDQSSEV